MGVIKHEATNSFASMTAFVFIDETYDVGQVYVFSFFKRCTIGYSFLRRETRLLGTVMGLF